MASIVANGSVCSGRNDDLRRGIGMATRALSRQTLMRGSPDGGPVERNVKFKLHQKDVI